MDVIQTKQHINIRMFYNLVDCPHRGNCDGQEAREKKLGRIFYLKQGHCSFNPSIFECEVYQDFNDQSDEQKIMDLRCL